MFHIFDVRIHDVDEFCIYLPDESQDDELIPPAVKLECRDNARSFLIYDPRRHTANIFAWREYANLEPRFTNPITCQNCGGVLLRVAVGFEIPSDSESPNDTSWFALAGTCVRCGASGMVFDDETA